MDTESGIKKYETQVYKHLEKALNELKKAGDICRIHLYPHWQTKELNIEKAVDIVESIKCACKGIN